MKPTRIRKHVSQRDSRNTLAVLTAMADGTTPVLEQKPAPRKQKPRAEREAGVADAIKEWRKSRPDVRLWRQNVGEFQLADGRYFRAGLCRGSSDFVGLRTIEITQSMVGSRVAVFVALELKKPGEMPEPHQQEWLDEIRDAGGVAGVVRNAQDAEDLLRG